MRDIFFERNKVVIIGLSIKLVSFFG